MIHTLMTSIPHCVLWWNGLLHVWEWVAPRGADVCVVPT
jgi:hypothetical protein